MGTASCQLLRRCLGLPMLQLVSFACIAPALLVSAFEDNDEYKLQAHLAEMEALNPAVRPVPVWTDRVNVEVAVNFNGLISVDEGGGSVSNSMIMMFTWDDHFVRWKTDQFRVPYIYINAGDMWVPDVV